MALDIALVEKARNGDKECFGLLYEDIAKELYRVALYTLGNSFDAQDAVSETFIEAYKGIANLRDPNAFKPWIMRILSFRCKRKIGHYVKTKGDVELEEVENFIKDDASPLEESVIEKTALTEALNTLSPEERQIVVLSAVEGYTAKEISKMLDTPIGTISSKLYRALIKLRKILEK